MLRNIVSAFVMSVLVFSAPAQTIVFVATNGNDAGNGSVQKPFKTIRAAIAATRSMAGKDVMIALRHGIYYPNSTIVITPENCFGRSLTIRGYKNERAVLSGAKPYRLNWQLYKPGIFKAKLDLAEKPDRLFFNGVSLPMARYPNYDSNARVFNGTAADALSRERINRWKNPAGAYIHALHKGEWGGFHYRVTGKDAGGNLLMEGGWQNNRPSPMHERYRFVENVFEELDAPGEWYFDEDTKTLYVYPPRGGNIQKATIEMGRLQELVVLKGQAGRPLKNIVLQNIWFEHTNRTFMLTREPLLRSDWTIYRGAAVLLEQTEHCSILRCNFTGLGGNAIFFSNYNKNGLAKENHIYDIGASAIAFVGNPAAVRSPSFGYEAFVPWNQQYDEAGPRSNDYPQQCRAEGNLIHSIGRIEKQVAGVEIDMASGITVSHNSIYTTPRAGINIGDGCWGGQVLEYNDVFNTVMETGDHGAFNAWGRDRFWRPQRSIIDSIVAARPGIELLDITSPNIIRNNRFQCDHGWDIDLDDGSTRYRIYNNICLNGGLKLREGYDRIVYNNIIVNNTFHPHVWLKNSGDVFMHNIVTAPYAPILMDSWGKQIDSNFFLSQKGLNEARQYGVDGHSSAGDAGFMDADAGNYRIKPGSPPLQTGFRNFDMNTGVQLPALKNLAARPPNRPLITDSRTGAQAHMEWLGATVKNIETLGEQSAAGLPDNKGVLMIQVPAGSTARKNGLQKGDVIIKMGDKETATMTDLWQLFQKTRWMGTIELTVMRNQSPQTIIIKRKE